MYSALNLERAEEAFQIRQQFVYMARAATLPEEKISKNFRSFPFGGHLFCPAIRCPFPIRPNPVRPSRIMLENTSHRFLKSPEVPMAQTGNRYYDMIMTSCNNVTDRCEEVRVQQNGDVENCSRASDVFTSAESLTTECSGTQMTSTDFKKSFSCPQCKYETDRKNNLKRHIITMHFDSDRKLECCGANFRSKAKLREHVILFHKDGYRCMTCGRIFCRKALLRRHMAVHSGRKDFLCSLCDYATSHKSNLERHQKVHMKTKGPPNCGIKLHFAHRKYVRRQFQSVGKRSVLYRPYVNSRSKTAESDFVDGVSKISRNTSQSSTQCQNLAGMLMSSLHEGGDNLSVRDEAAFVSKRNENLNFGTSLKGTDQTSDFGQATNFKSDLLNLDENCNTINLSEESSGAREQEMDELNFNNFDESNKYHFLLVDGKSEDTYNSMKVSVNCRPADMDSAKNESLQNISKDALKATADDNSIYSESNDDKLEDCKPVSNEEDAGDDAGDSNNGNINYLTGERNKVETDSVYANESVVCTGYDNKENILGREIMTFDQKLVKVRPIKDAMRLCVMPYRCAMCKDRFKTQAEFLSHTCDVNMGSLVQDSGSAFSLVAKIIKMGHL